MEKKTYKRPGIDVRRIDMSVNVLQGSVIGNVNNENIGYGGEESTPHDPQAKQINIWEFNEE